jgi:hypothetical protein
MTHELYNSIGSPLVVTLYVATRLPKALLEKEEHYKKLAEAPPPP